jgi:signal transduction histidine kinase
VKEDPIKRLLRAKNDAVIAYVKTAREGARRAQDLVNLALAAARAERALARACEAAGRLKHVEGNLAVAEILDEDARRWRLVYQRKAVVVSVNDAGRPEIVDAKEQPKTLAEQRRSRKHYR